MPGNTFELFVPEPDVNAETQVKKRLDTLCKTDEGLGELENILIRLAGIQGTPNPMVKERALLIFAGDHGVTEEGVSKFARADSAKMVRGILLGRTAAGVLARDNNIAVYCFDVGLMEDVDPGESLFKFVPCKLARGTGNIIKEPAMTREQCMSALDIGAGAVRSLSKEVRLIALGEMGMGNTTLAATLTAALLGEDARNVVGMGAGNSNLELKINIVQNALATHSSVVEQKNPFEILATLGGLEIAALTGACLQAAALRKGIVLDGLVTSVAALLACRINPRVVRYLFASHLAPEPGHGLILQYLGLRTVLDLRLRVGEGAGALLIFPLLDQSVLLLDDLARFAELGILS